MTDCTKQLRWREGVPSASVHLHEIRRGSVFTVGGKRGKLVDIGASCTVRWAKTTRRFNVGTGRYRTKHGWGKPVQVSACMEIDNGKGEASCE